MVNPELPGPANKAILGAILGVVVVLIAMSSIAIFSRARERKRLKTLSKSR